jgi:hypothetical protein
MKENITYNLLARSFVKDVSQDDLNLLVNLFMNDAAVIMGNDYNENSLDMIIEIVRNQYSYLPVFFIASAFKKGALGKYGKEGSGRLTPRTINAWIEFEALEYNKYLAHKEQKEKEFRTYDSMDLVKFPAGQAIIKKIDWYKKGIIDGDDWDKIPLKEMAERIGQGLDCVPEIFGVTSLKPKVGSR